MRVIIKFISFIFIINFIILCSLSWCWADDFGIYNNIKFSNGIINSLFYGYFNWDGRFLSVTSLFQAILIYLHNPVLGAFIWLTFFCSAISLLLMKLALFKIEKSNLFIILISFFITGMFEVASESVFWLTGGVYSLTIFIFIFWFYLIKKKIIENQRINKFLLILITIISAQNGPQVCASMITSIICLNFIVEKSFYTSKSFYYKSAGYIFLIIIFATITILAPGNNARINGLPNHTHKYDLVTLISNFISIMKVYLDCNKYFFITIFLMMYPVSIYIKDTYKEFLMKIKNEVKVLFMYLFIAFSSISPFIFYKDFATPRTTLIFSFFMFLSISPLVILFYKFIKFKIISKLFSYNLSIIFISILVMYFQFDWILRSFQTKYKVEKQYEEIEKYRGKNISLRIVKNKYNPPIIKKFNDIQDDTLNYINRDIAKYYGLKSIGFNNGK